MGPVKAAWGGHDPGADTLVGSRVRPRIYFVIFERLVVVVAWSGLGLGQSKSEFQNFKKTGL